MSLNVIGHCLFCLTVLVINAFILSLREKLRPSPRINAKTLAIKIAVSDLKEILYILLVSSTLLTLFTNYLSTFVKKDIFKVPPRSDFVISFVVSSSSTFDLNFVCISSNKLVNAIEVRSLKFI